jgi:hypothetical protein
VCTIWFSTKTPAFHSQNVLMCLYILLGFVLFVTKTLCVNVIHGDNLLSKYTQFVFTEVKLS